MSDPLTFRNSAGMSGNGKLLLSANHTFRLTTESDKLYTPVLPCEAKYTLLELFCHQSNMIG